MKTFDNVEYSMAAMSLVQVAFDILISKGIVTESELSAMILDKAEMHKEVNEKTTTDHNTRVAEMLTEFTKIAVLQDRHLPVEVE